MEAIQLSEKNSVYELLEQSLLEALRTYSNVHRGTGHYSMITTELYERARGIILDHLNLSTHYTVIFCTAYSLEMMKKYLSGSPCHVLTSRDIGLPLGVSILAVKKTHLPRGAPFHTGGDVIKLVSPRSVVWAAAPSRFEAGTPSVINVIAFTRALQIMKTHGAACFYRECSDASNTGGILNTDALSGLTGNRLFQALRTTLIGREITVPTKTGNTPYINFDNAASTPAFYPVWESYRKALHLNIDSRKNVIEEVRSIISTFLGAPSETYKTLFVRNATEAINIAARSLMSDSSENEDCVIMNTLMEHHSNELPWRYLPEASLIRIPVDSNGFISMHALEEAFIQYNRRHLFGSKRIRLLAVSGASNVLGTINDITAVSALAHSYGSRILVDAAQLAAHREINMDRSDVDYLAFSGHKMYAPFGSGALVMKKKYLQIRQTELELIERSGEENAAGIAALGKSAQLLMRIGMDVIEQEEKKLVTRILEGLSHYPEIQVFGIDDPSSEMFASKGGVIAFAFRHVPHNLAAKELAEKGGIGVRNGCFCAHLITKHLMHIHPFRSFVADLGMMLIPRFTKRVIPGIVRVSIGLENDADEVDRFLEIIKEITAAPRSGIDAFLGSTYNGTPFIPASPIQRLIERFIYDRIKKVFE